MIERRRSLDTALCAGLMLEIAGGNFSSAVDTRITQLEDQLQRLRADLERLGNAVWLLQEKQRPDWFRRAYFALLIAQAVLFGVIWCRTG
jgi:hypothetical protein